ncbi:MAG: TrmH family RNA methyltransferase [Limosilactobacillus sp.]
MHNLTFLPNLTGPEMDPYVRLNEAQLFHAAKPSLFIAESPKVIERALRAGYRPASLLMEDKTLERDLTDLDHEMAANQTRGLGRTPIYVVSDNVLRQLAGNGYNLLRGALAAMYRMPRPDLASFLASLPTDHPRIAVLERVVNPANVGAIFRSAAALGIDGVVITSDCADPLYRRASRTAMGTVFQVPWTYVDARDWQEAGIALLHRAGYRTAAMALRHNTVSIADPRLDAVDKLAVILGSEGPGLMEKTIAQSDFTIKIPMAAGVDSLNVAAASALAFWELGNHTNLR